MKFLKAAFNLLKSLFYFYLNKSRSYGILKKIIVAFKQVRTIMSILFSQEEVTERYGYERFLEGRNEEKETIARKMLQKKINIEEISEFTQLSPTHIRRLAKTL